MDQITVNPRQCGGRPCIRGMRIRVSDVLELLASGMTVKQILKEHPDLEAEDIQACLRYASARLGVAADRVRHPGDGPVARAHHVPLGHHGAGAGDRAGGHREVLTLPRR